MILKLSFRISSLLAMTALLASMLCTAVAQDSSTPPQFISDHWGTGRGFPGEQVFAIAQTSDGFLWIGTEKGLVRFDGLTFHLFQHSNTPTLPDGSVLGLAAEDNGSLWIRLQGPIVLRYREGVFQPVVSELERTEASITAMCRGVNGEIILSGLNNGTLKHSNGRFETLASAANMPNFLVISMAETSEGYIWLGTRDAGLFRLHNGVISPAAAKLPDRKVNCLLTRQNGELWIGTDNGVVRLAGDEMTRKETASALEHAQVFTMIEDRESNVWVGTATGLWRVTSTVASQIDPGSPKSAGPVTALFEDREGNIWTGSGRGIERLRATTFMSFSASDGLPSSTAGPVYVDSENRIWFGPPSGGLYWLKNSHVEKVSVAGLADDVVYSITGEDGDLWLGRQKGGLTRLRLDAPATAKTYTQSDGLSQNSVYSVCRSRDGAVWAGTLSGGVNVLRNGVFTSYSTSSGLVSNSINSVLEARDASMWFATPQGLASFSNGQWRAYSLNDGLPSENVNCLFEDSAGTLWVGTAAGLTSVKSGEVELIREPPDMLRESILGLAEDKTGWLWVTTPNHLLRVRRDELLRGDTNGRAIREYGLVDGLPSAEGVKRDRSVVSDSAGRIWFSLNRGLSVVDPGRLTRSSAPALVHVQAVSADGTAVDLKNPINIPSNRKRITFTFVALSLAVPERVKYRYRLDGFDHGWSEPTATREAIYTNLGPGTYEFHAIASNSDGVWNSDETTIAFVIEPVFWQTLWFRLVAVAALLLLLLGLYRLRLFQLTRQLNVRFEERLSERTRIAQELHDTLLQGFLSASMQLHVAVDQLPPESPNRPLFTRILQLMSHVVDEGRNAVRGLRSSSHDTPELELAFSRIQQELSMEGQVSFRVIVEGRPRPLHPIIRNEVYRIGREALLNSFRHARARKIEVELEYGSKQLRLLVRDDGKGIDADIIKSGRDGHWGLSGMRERAEGIGARLNLFSRTSAGTEVELSVPSNLAFEAESSDHSNGWFAKLLPGRRRSNRNGRENSK